MRLMRRLLLTLLVVGFTAGNAFGQVPLWGEYTNETRGIQIAPRPNDEVEVVVFEGGLPGAGWTGKEPQRFLDDPVVAEALVEGMTRVVRTSPTEGAVPPSGAVVLYGQPRDALKWRRGAKAAEIAVVTEDGLLNGGVTTQSTFEDFTLHMEFLVPFQPDRLANFPGNSGIYLQDRYEIQILDDFGREMRPNLCGSIYRLSEPLLNACYPPGQWQTYDIDFRAARFDAAGEKTDNARVTVRQNGQLIHDNVEIASVTAGNHLEENAEPGPIHLQNHGDPVVFRNVWLLPVDESKLAKRPRVSAFERLAGTAPTAAHGELLLSELACTACHAEADEDSWRYRSVGPDLSRLSSRVQADWLSDYLADPHGVKPGTKMPDALSGLSDGERTRAASELAAFLLKEDGQSEAAAPNWFEAARGKLLFNSIGCTACHQPSDLDRELATSVPFGDVSAKYRRGGLIGFLKNTHAVRSSGRMPSLGLKDDEASAIASYLLLPPGAEMPADGLTATFVPANVSRFSDFDKKFANQQDKASSGPVLDFAINTFPRQENFLLRFEGVFTVKEAGRYRFRIGSDDGSRIQIDGAGVAIVDGTHPYVTSTGELDLTPGEHLARIDFFQAGGGMELTVDWAGPDVGDDWTPMAGAFLKAEAPAETVSPQETRSAYAYSPDLAKRGKERFASLGCANCHSAAEDVKPIVSGPSLATLASIGGCLSESPKPGLPNYDLSSIQRTALTRALSEKQTVDPVQHVLASHNCVACHVRDGIGGPEPSRDAYFLTTIQEMGEEGRVPPMLDRVGDKLKAAWLRTVLQDGQNVRPYMTTRMPAFKMNHPGRNNIGTVLADAFIASDRKVESPLPKLTEGMHRTRTAGRLLVDNGGLACVKCHSFGNYRGLGIQAVNLLDMTPRLREDWVHRYIMNPASLRPGTRMPSGFPNGKSVVEDLYAGDPSSQIAAIWGYLKEGKQAAVPKGLLPSPIELKPETEPIIYRNFLSGLSPRGIGVGYPERVNIAFDAERGALTLLWQNDFIDAAKHWQGRGPGTQGPMGDNVVTYQRQPAVASLESKDAAWPAESDVTFLGYSLDEKRRPAFRYVIGDLTVEDHLVPFNTEDRLGLRRTLRISGNGGLESAFFRLAASSSLTADGDGFRTAEGILVRVLSGQPDVVSSGGLQELRVAASATAGLLDYELTW